MATWKSRHTVEWSRDMGFNYAECKNEWSYATVSDFLTVHTHTGAYDTFTETAAPSIEHTHYSKTEALALLETLLDWAYTYEGSPEVEAILARVKKST